MTEALVRLVQQRVFSVLVETAGPLKEIDLGRLAKTIGDLSHTTITHGRWQAEVQERLEKQQRAATTKLTAMKRAGGLSREATEQMRNLLLGINPFAAETDAGEEQEN